MKDMRIVITGMGAVTPIGIGVKNYWQSLISGRSGVRRISRFPVDDLDVKIAAEINDFLPEEVLPRKMIRETDLFMQYAYKAADEALTNGMLMPELREGVGPMIPERLGIVVGTALGGIRTTVETQSQLVGEGPNRISPHFVPKMLANIAAARISIAYGFSGPSLTVNTACSSGADAIGLAAMLVRSGAADAVLAVGADAIICPLMISGLASAKALSKMNDLPEKASRPFDALRDGFVMGEGAGALLVESIEHANKRGASIEAELLAYSSLTEAYHVTLPEPGGRGEILCMKKALTQAGISPDAVDYINAHGTSTKAGDLTETKAIKTVFGASAAKLPVSSTKGATGHLMGAGGVTELIACIKSIQESTIPPTINQEQTDPECDLDYVPNIARHVPVKIAISNAFGFGGQNTCLIVGKVS